MKIFYRIRKLIKLCLLDIKIKNSLADFADEYKIVNEMVKKWKKMEIELGDEFKNLNSIDYFKCPNTGFSWYEPKEAAGSSNLYEQLEKYDGKKNLNFYFN
jgi:hypothetical protein